MGVVRKPEDLINKRGKSVPDLAPMPVPRPIMPTSVDDILQEINSLKAEIEKIKRALKTHGITVK